MKGKGLIIMKSYIAIFSATLTLSVPIEAVDEDDAEDEAFKRLKEKYKYGPFDESDNVQLAIISAEKDNVTYGGLTG